MGTVIRYEISAIRHSSSPTPLPPIIPCQSYANARRYALNTPCHQSSPGKLTKKPTRKYTNTSSWKTLVPSKFLPKPPSREPRNSKGSFEFTKKSLICSPEISLTEWHSITPLMMMVAVAIVVLSGGRDRT